MRLYSLSRSQTLLRLVSEAWETPLLLSLCPPFSVPSSSLLPFPPLSSPLLHVHPPPPLSTQVISQNPQAFIDLLNSAQPGPAGQAAGQAGGGAAGQGAPPQGGAPFGMPMTIQVTPQEKEAIERVGIECGLTLSLSQSHCHAITHYQAIVNRHNTHCCNDLMTHLMLNQQLISLACKLSHINLPDDFLGPIIPTHFFFGVCVFIFSKCLLFPKKLPKVMHTSLLFFSCS